VFPTERVRRGKRKIKRTRWKGKDPGNPWVIYDQGPFPYMGDCGAQRNRIYTTQPPIECPIRIPQQNPSALPSDLSGALS